MPSVEKTREKGRVVEIATRVVFGTMAAVMAALGMSKVSRAINTAFVERQNGTDRHRNARKARKTYRFSKDWRYHEAVTYLTLYIYNFCWPVRTLGIKDDQGRWQRREPGDGGGTGGSCLVNLRMAVVPSRATLIGHEEILRGGIKFYGSLRGRESFTQGCNPRQLILPRPRAVIESDRDDPESLLRRCDPISIENRRPRVARSAGGESHFAPAATVRRASWTPRAADWRVGPAVWSNRGAWQSSRSCRRS